MIRMNTRNGWNCPRAAETCVGRFFAAVTLTLKLDRDLDILKTYLESNKCTTLKVKVNCHQSLLAFTTGHIPTKLHQFLFNSFRDFVRTDRHTDRQMPPKTIPARSIAGADMQTQIKFKQNITNVSYRVAYNCWLHCQSRVPLWQHRCCSELDKLQSLAGQHHSHQMFCWC